MLRKRFVPELLMALHDSPLADGAARTAALAALCRAAHIPAAARDLALHSGAEHSGCHWRQKLLAQEQYAVGVFGLLDSAAAPRQGGVSLRTCPPCRLRPLAGGGGVRGAGGCAAGRGAGRGCAAVAAERAQRRVLRRRGCHRCVDRAGALMCGFMQWLYEGGSKVLPAGQPALQCYSFNCLTPSHASNISGTGTLSHLI